MTRVGVPAWHDKPKSIDDVVRLAKSIKCAASATFQGIYTHFPRADEGATPGTGPYNVTTGQIETMEMVWKQLQSEGVHCQMVHMANSAAIETYPDSFAGKWITHVRPGSIIYGMSANNPRKFQRVLSWESSLARVECIKWPAGLGYGHSHTVRPGD